MVARDIVDIEPAAGNVYKMLLGSIVEAFDNHDDTRVESAIGPTTSTDLQSGRRLRTGI